MASVTITIPDAKLAEFKVGFLKCNPVPTDEDTGDPLFTEDAWMKEWARREYLKMYSRGKRQIATETATLDNDIVE
jgi:hypothetical protein